MTTTQINLRVDENALAEIDRRAEAAGQTRTAYLLTCALADDAAAAAGARADLRRLSGELMALSVAAGTAARGQSATAYLDSLEDDDE